MDRKEFNNFNFDNSLSIFDNNEKKKFSSFINRDLFQDDTKLKIDLKEHMDEYTAKKKRFISKHD